MFNFIYVVSDVLLVVLNTLLLKDMHFENVAWPIIALAIPASLYLALIDIDLYYNYLWFNWDPTYLFSTKILIYKLVIAAALLLSVIRIPIVHLDYRFRRRTEKERLGGK